jgi:hypothetical protein
MWDDLNWLGLQVRPLSDLRPETLWRRSAFQATLRSTLRTLATELRALEARHVVLELDVRERDIRVDGYPKANAVTASPVVVISFDSKHGPLRYATGEYDDWRDNLRAIALSMSALRTVDRYGVAKRGEQYRGWKALPPGPVEPADLIRNESEARAFLDEHGGSFTEAAKRLHPDVGGDEQLFRAATKARDLLGVS